jgi:hypothetical protein
MTVLVWDDVGERTYEYGVDRGVLYLSDGTGVPWNGLTSVEERFVGAEASPLYWDGIKYDEIYSVADFSASVKAFTYPDEFLEYEGIQEINHGLHATGQMIGRFGLSYRTGVGNDINQELGYKIHILDKLAAIPSPVSYKVNAPKPSMIEFEWTVTGIPSWIPGYRPTAHLIFDTTKSSEGFIEELEAILYGNESGEAHLPALETIVELAHSWAP